MTDPRTPDNVVIIDAGTLTFSDEDLTATGLLLPYGVPSRSNLGTFTFSAGDIAIPEDLAGMSLNEEHRREAVVGMFTKVWEQPETGLFSAFKFANTVAGRLAFANAKSGKRKNLSAEVANVRIQGGKALPGAVLFAGAVVEKPAFEGATLLAAEDTSNLSIGATEDTVTYTEEEVRAAIEQVMTTLTAPQTDPETPVIEDPDASTTPVEDPLKKKEFTMTASAVVEPVAGAQIPATLLASAPAQEQEVNLSTLFAAMASIKGGAQSEDANTLLAALADIKTTGTGALPAAGIVQPTWVGKLWEGKDYVRKYLPLNNHTFGDISIGGRAGFRLDQGTALVQKRGQEKTELPTGSASTSKRESTRDSFGYAADVAAEWTYLSGGAEIMESFWKGVATSYAKVTDLEALATMYRVASRDTGAALSRLKAPGSLPAGTPANSAYYPGVVQLIQAIEAITDADDDPAWAIVNPVLWSQLIYTPKDLLPEFLKIDVGIGTGQASAGQVTVRKAPASTFIGLSATAPAVFAGSKNAIEFRELGETPIQIDAVNVAKFGVDRATVGFLETFVVRPEATVLIGTV